MMEELPSVDGAKVGDALPVISCLAVNVAPPSSAEWIAAEGGGATFFLRAES